MTQQWTAVGRRNMREVEKLESGTNERLCSHPSRPTSLHAVLSWLGNENLALLMLDHGADVNACDAYGNSVLHVALARFYSIAFVRELLNRGAKVDVTNLQAIGILTVASWHPAAKFLLPMLIEGDFVDGETKNWRGIMALYYLIDSDRDNLEAMEAVLALDLPIDRLCKSGFTLLHHAVLTAKTKKVKLLLRYGADVNAKSTDNNMTPLFAALHLKKSAMAKLLIERGANIHDRYDNGLFPVHGACQAGSYENIELLLRLGVDVNVADKRGRTPFYMLRFVVRSHSCVMLFIKHFALLNERGIPVNESDSKLMRVAGLQSVFEEYSRELQEAKQVKIYNSISFFCVLTKNVRELSLLMKNSDFVKKYTSYPREVLCPTYYDCIEFEYKIAENRKNLMLSSFAFLENLFGGMLPSLIVEKIAYHLCHDQLAFLRRNYILSLY